MVTVPAGAFMMGCDAATEPFCDPSEQPYHAVTLSTYDIDRTEVTEARYAQCVAAGACGSDAIDLSHPDLPITNVTWDRAQTYCAWAGKRLPTEAEWEKAARGTDSRPYPWGTDPPNCTLANIANCTGSPGMPLPVGTHPTGASPYGLQDMAGNVEEWVADWFDPNYFAVSPTTDPPGPSTGSERVVRGGAYLGSPFVLKTYWRLSYHPESVFPMLGFRCAK